MNKSKLKGLLFFLLLIQLHVVFGQNDAFTNEITYQGDKVFYENKPLTGLLFSAEDGISNKCDCTLKAKYKNGLLNGYEKKWYSNGKPKEFSNYSHGVILNKTRYYSNGVIKKKETYSNGNLVSSELYNKDGSRKGASEVVYTQQKTPLITSENNTTNNEEQPQAVYTPTTINTISYQRQGLIKAFFPNGKIKKVTLYKNGMLVKDSLFYKNGNLNITKKYADGELIRIEEYLPNKTLKKEQNFINNKKHGVHKINYKNGSTKTLENYKNGELTHKESYFENGDLSSEENYNFGKKHGIQKTFDTNGKLKILEEYQMNILVRNEKYTPEGKEITRKIKALSEVKNYDSSDRLIAVKYQNTKTKQKDSVWTTYNPVTGFKEHEIAYLNGFKIREGAYQNNQKQGVWHYYLTTKKGEILKWFKDNKRIKTKSYTYAKQIKNNIQKNDVLLRYFTSIEEDKHYYILLRLFQGEKDQYLTEINKSILSAFKKYTLQEQDINEIKNEELTTSFIFKELKYKFKPKKQGSKKNVVFINSEFTIYNFNTLKNITKNITVSPVNKKNKNIKSLYTKDVQEAFTSTLNNYTKIIEKLLQEKYPITGKISRIIEQNKKEINEVVVFIKKIENIAEKDVLIIYDKKQNVMVKMKVDKIKNNTASCKIKEGGQWLKDYMKTVTHPVVLKAITLE